MHSISNRLTQQSQGHWVKVFLIIKIILCSHKHKKTSTVQPRGGRYTPAKENFTIPNTTSNSSQSPPSESINIAPHAPIDTLRLMCLFTHQYDVTSDDASLSLSLYLTLIYFFSLLLPTPFTRFIWKCYLSELLTSVRHKANIVKIWSAISEKIAWKDRQTDRQTDDSIPPSPPFGGWGGGGGIKSAIKAILKQAFKTHQS
jgi:hypothetical protein